MQTYCELTDPSGNSPDTFFQLLKLLDSCVSCAFHLALLFSLLLLVKFQLNIKSQRCRCHAVVVPC